jgi:putative heme-binding domain-containing protein
MAGNEASPVCRSEIMMITRSDDASTAPFSAYEETDVPADRLFSELEDPSCQRRYRAHVELMRRGQSIQAGVVSRLQKAPVGGPIQSSLIWLAAAGGESQPIKALAVSPNDSTRLNAIRALTQSGWRGEDCRLFEQALEDPNPQVALAALIGVFDLCSTFPRGRVFALATNGDSFLRQTAVQLLAEKAPLVELQQLSESARPESRFAGVLALGFRLTVPRATNVLSAEFPLNAKGFSARVQYVDGLEDLAAQGRLGVFTIADVWAHGTRTQEDDMAFALLQRRLNDADERVAKQAAFFAWLLKDQRTDAMASAILGTLPDTQTNSPIANARSTGATALPSEFLSLDWEKEAAHGDSKKGEDLFTARGCAVCHSVRPDDKGAGGPSLAGAGSRFNVNYLVESVIVPNKTVAPMFRWTLLRLKDGDDLAGLVTGETEDEIQLLLPAGVRRVVHKNEVAKREIQERSPMPEGLIQTPGELRDLLAYLLSQK